MAAVSLQSTSNLPQATQSTSPTCRLTQTHTAPAQSSSLTVIPCFKNPVLTSITTTCSTTYFTSGLPQLPAHFEDPMFRLKELLNLNKFTNFGKCLNHTSTTSELPSDINSELPSDINYQRNFHSISHTREEDQRKSVRSYFLGLATPLDFAQTFLSYFRRILVSQILINKPASTTSWENGLIRNFQHKYHASTRSISSDVFLPPAVKQN